jgi:murein DD-endopeptidase MepM/ murein hydrolase activator NlpD
MRAGVVSGDVGARVLRFGDGPTVEAYSGNDQPSDDPVRANRSGWNARTHVDYEGQPAVDWYIPPGTPVVATMDGTATLLINTVANPFAVYGVDREPYIGNPDRARAPISPFSGPGGGQGIFVRIESDGFRADHAHLGIDSIGRLPGNAFIGGYSATTDFATTFAALRDYRLATAVARWDVKRGDVIGLSGDTGYSEAPHLHYAITRLGAGNNLCPTTEAGFADGGWLFKA